MDPRHESHEARSFDREAQNYFAGLFRSCPPERFLAELQTYAPASEAGYVDFHKYRGWALYDSGQYDRARPSLARALRASSTRSDDRSLLYGLLAESYLRVGRYSRAERCTRRALSCGSRRDPGHFLEAGHLLALARILLFSGHLSHSMGLRRRARSLLRATSPHWVTLVAGAAQTHLYRGELKLADESIREAREAPFTGRQQEWVIASIECPIAIAMGDVERANRVVSDAIRIFYGPCGKRVQLLLTELRASVFHARGLHPDAERLFRDILEQAVLGGTNHDAVASAARGLAEALMGQDRHEEALETTHLAVRAGRADNRSEWAVALRLRGECYWAVGRRNEARRAFDEARSLHACTQFAAERKRLELAMRRTSGRAFLGARDLGGPRPALGPVVHRFPLPSGRTFLSCDTQLVQAIHAAAKTDLPVLVEGETGTGKEMVSQLVHGLSGRVSGPWVVIDCTTLPETLADVELFGAARGAYTGAVQAREGLLAQADGGTVLLDELTELSTTLQAKLLRVVQDGVYRRVGEVGPRRLEVRFIATTNRSVESLLASGKLKPDLFYRLSGHRLLIRPLRKRPEEIGPLAREIVRRAGCVGLAPGVLSLLEAQPWPGNIRQLDMTLRLAAGSCGANGLVRRSDVQAHLDPAPTRDDPAPDDASLRARRTAAERSAITRALEKNDGVVARAARDLGISRQALHKALRRNGLK